MNHLWIGFLCPNASDTRVSYFRLCWRVDLPLALEKIVSGEETQHRLPLSPSFFLSLRKGWALGSVAFTTYSVPEAAPILLGLCGPTLSMQEATFGGSL